MKDILFDYFLWLAIIFVFLFIGKETWRDYRHWRQVRRWKKRAWRSR